MQTNLKEASGLARNQERAERSRGDFYSPTTQHTEKQYRARKERKAREGRVGKVRPRGQLCLRGSQRYDIGS